MLQSVEKKFWHACIWNDVPFSLFSKSILITKNRQNSKPSVTLHKKWQGVRFLLFTKELICAQICFSISSKIISVFCYYSNSTNNICSSQILFGNPCIYNSFVLILYTWLSPEEFPHMKLRSMYFIDFLNLLVFNKKSCFKA